MAVKQIRANTPRSKITQKLKHKAQRGGDATPSMSAKIRNIIQRTGLLGGIQARNTRKYGEGTADSLQRLRKQISSAQSNLSSRQSHASSLALSRSKSGVPAAKREVQNARIKYRNARAAARLSRTPHSYA